MHRSVCVVITARPSYSRVKTVLEAIRNHSNLKLQLVVAASALLDRYGKIVDEIEQDGFEIAERVYMVLEGENPTSMAKTTGMGIMELATAFLNLAPDVVVTVADRYETIATAIAGAYMNIPVAHIQGGEVTGSIDEKVRHAVTKLADIHCVASSAARNRLIRLGEDSRRIYETGCPSIDLAIDVLESPELGYNPTLDRPGVGNALDLTQGYVVILQHPVTTEYRESRGHVIETLLSVQQLGMPVLWFWPNVDAGADGTSAAIRQFRELQDCANFHFFKNLPAQDFLRLLYGARCLIGNSSVGIRECAFLGVPVVNIGSRQSGRERGCNVIDVEYDRDSIGSAIQKQVSHGRYPTDSVYGNGNAGKQIAAALADCPLTTEKRICY